MRSGDLAGQAQRARSLAPLLPIQPTAAINMADRDMLRRVWDEFSYRLDVVRAARGGHIEHL